MILLNTFIGLFAIFLSPQIFLYYRYTHLNYSLLLSYGLILSFTGAWIILLSTYYLDLPNIFIYSIACIIMLASLFYMYISKKQPTKKNYSFLYWGLALIIMLPLLQYIGIGFSVWDVLASWNNWAMQLFENEYYPIDAAYPVLMPALWSLIYKIQGTSEIWWTAQITLFILPVITLVLLLSLYNETKNRSYIFMAIFIYPYLISIQTINGNMDMPVMIMGTLSLILLYSAEQYKGSIEFDYYVYASLLLAGIASIIKQPGFAFILFNLIYITLNINFFHNKKRLLLIIFFTFSYFISYLSIYYQNNIASPTGNFDHLGNLSQQKLSEYSLDKYLQWLYSRYFQLPSSIPFFAPILALAKIKIFTPFLIILGLVLFVFKKLRQVRSVTFLSGIFFILGTIVWIKFFSYDERNALWVKSFLIVFLSINLNYFITIYKHKTIYSKVMFSTILLGVSLYLYSLGDTFAYAKQKTSQLKAGVKYGCMPSIKYAAELLKDKDPCVKIYTNELPMPHNHLLKPYKDKFILMGRDYKFQRFDYLNHECKAGRYIIFRKNSLAHPHEWWKVEKLTNDGIITPVKDANVLAYFVPPHIQIEDDYFRKTDIVDFKLLPHKNNIKYYVDKYIEDSVAHTFLGWAFIENAQIDKTKKYLLLISDTHEYIVRMRVQKRPDLSKTFKAKNLNNAGFLTYIHKEDFPKGTYNVYLLLVEEDNTQYQISLNKKIKI